MTTTPRTRPDETEPLVPERQGELLDARIGRIATAQHGVITSAQLQDAGLSTPAIAKRAGTGRLHRVHRGVYAVGHRCLSFPGRCMAACLAVGGDALVTGEALAHLLGVQRCEPVDIDVVASTQRRRVAGIRTMTSTTLMPDDATTAMGIPVATTARMLVDLALTWRPTQLANAMHELAYQERLFLDQLDACAARNRQRRGSRALAQALHLHRCGSAGTQSWFERSVLDELLVAGAPMPRINCRVRLPDGRHVRPDFVWDATRLVVEVDGPGHDRPGARAADASRDEQFGVLGMQVIRVRRSNRHDAVRRILRIVT